MPDRVIYQIRPKAYPFDRDEPMPGAFGFTERWTGVENFVVHDERTQKLWDEGVTRARPINNHIVAGRPVPSYLVPGTLERPGTINFGGYNLMPDFFGLRGQKEFYVSSRFRNVIESYAPGLVEYIPIRAKVAPRKNPAEAYFFINVLARACLTDWERSTLEDSIDNQLRVVDNRYGGWKLITAIPPGHPAIWHETKEVFREGKPHLTPNVLLLVTEGLAERLREAFPKQILFKEFPLGGG